VTNDVTDPVVPDECF